MLPPFWESFAAKTLTACVVVECHYTSSLLQLSNARWLPLSSLAPEKRNRLMHAFHPMFLRQLHAGAIVVFMCKQMSYIQLVNRERVTYFFQRELLSRRAAAFNFPMVSSDKF